MELDLLEKKIRRLVCKLKKHNVDLEVFDHTDIEYGCILGKGSEGLVQRCTIKYNGLPVDAAVKTVLDTSDDAIAITLEEIELLCLARDPIVQTTLRVYGVAMIPDENDTDMAHLAIVTEAGIMNALQLYQAQPISLAVTLDLWANTAAALYMMHVKHIMHQDIKPENILITGVSRDVSGQIEKVECKIIDLGMGKRVYTERVVTDDILGTNGYHPPEVLAEDGYDFRADVFMLGITFCVLLHSPDFLKSQLPALLKKLHATNKLGTKLYEELLEANVLQCQTIPRSIKKMLCNMLEGPEDRTLTLLDLVDICREESEKMRQELRLMPPLLTHCGGCQDSGFSSGIDHSGGGTDSSLFAMEMSRRSRLSTASSCSSCSINVLSASMRSHRKQRYSRGVNGRLRSEEILESPQKISQCDNKRKSNNKLVDDSTPPLKIPLPRKRKRSEEQDPTSPSKKPRKDKLSYLLDTPIATRPPLKRSRRILKT